MNRTTEAQARITINKLLEEAGWRFHPDAHGQTTNIQCEHRVTRAAIAQDLGNDFEHAPQGFVDYLLLNTDRRPVAVVEAKRESIDPLTAKEQARGYAESLGVSHIFLSNGLVHYYWNLRQGNPVKVSRFLPLEELGKAADWRPEAGRRQCGRELHRSVAGCRVAGVLANGTRGGAGQQKDSAAA